jgi:deoxyadenosine/deoxycytidine kinase
LLILDKDKLDFANNPEDLGFVIESIEREINGLF